MEKIIRQLLTVLLLFVSYIGNGQSTNRAHDSIVSRKINSIIHKPPMGSINDMEGIFAPAEKRQLDSLVNAVEKKINVEIVVLTIDSVPYREMSFDSTALCLANFWWVGKRYNNKGILIDFSKHLRRIRIENSIEVEKLITNAETKEVIDNVIIPQFKQGNYYKAVEQGIIALQKKLK